MSRKNGHRFCQQIARGREVICARLARRGPNVRWRLASGAASLALVLACLLPAFGGELAADPGDGERTLGATAPGSTTDESDLGEEGWRPWAFKPQVPRPLTPADLPPPNALAAPSVSVVRGTSANFGGDWRASRNEYRAIIERESQVHGLPPALLDAVMAVESSYNPAVVGMDGEIGLMQVMPATARMLGFTGTLAELADPQINIHYGAKYLAGAWRLAGQDLCTATMKYRAGHGEKRFSFRSVEYCVRVRNHLAARGVAVSGAVPQPTFGRQGIVRGGGRSLTGLSRSGTDNFAALNAQLRALADRIAPRDPR